MPVKTRSQTQTTISQAKSTTEAECDLKTQINTSLTPDFEIHYINTFMNKMNDMNDITKYDRTTISGKNNRLLVITQIFNFINLNLTFLLKKILQNREDFIRHIHTILKKSNEFYNEVGTYRDLNPEVVTIASREFYATKIAVNMLLEQVENKSITNYRNISVQSKDNISTENHTNIRPRRNIQRIDYSGMCK